MLNDIDRILLTEEQLQGKVKELAARINEDYKDKNPMFIVILKGSFVFAADLYKYITLENSIDFMVVSSYASSAVSSGNVKIIKDVAKSIENKDVIIIEDIVDTGHTLSNLVALLKERKPASIEICSCVDKPERRVVPVDVKYKGFEVENEFIVGYGLDYAEKYRNLPFIGILKREVYERWIKICNFT